MSTSAKFWGRLSLWKVLLLFVITNVVMQLIGVVLREGFGLGFISPAGAAAAGAFVAIMIVSALASKQRNSGESSP